jgi:2-dehydro-3-deoxyphosphooctonate aldolase (KDO 8-P synthase)
LANLIKIGNLKVGKGAPLFLIAGPCVIESERLTLQIARELKKICARVGIGLIFKASFDKANRSSIDSFRGPGLNEGLRILKTVKDELGLLVLSDIHEPNQAEPASQVLDVIQIPAFLCRQTDLIVASAKTGKPLNIKKGQFMSPEEMANVVEKAERAGARKIILTERGTFFGYHNLVVDFRSFQIMKELGYPVVFDATHSVQKPGGAGKKSSGERKFIPMLTKAAVAAGVDGLFMEVHPHPEKALSDGANSLRLGELEGLLREFMKVASSQEKCKKKLQISDN